MEQGLHSGRLQPYLQTLDYIFSWATSDKHSSLLQTLVNYGSKKFYNSPGPELVVVGLEVGAGFAVDAVHDGPSSEKQVGVIRPAREVLLKEKT